MLAINVADWISVDGSLPSDRNLLSGSSSTSAPFYIRAIVLLHIKSIEQLTLRSRFDEISAPRFLACAKTANNDDCGNSYRASNFWTTHASG